MVTTEAWPRRSGRPGGVGRDGGARAPALWVGRSAAKTVAPGAHVPPGTELLRGGRDKLCNA